MLKTTRQFLGFLPSLLGLRPIEAGQTPQLLLPPPGPAFRPEERLTIPVVDSSAEDDESDAARKRGLFLARQDRWADLATEMRRAESQGRCTPGGLGVADLMAFGARSDIVLAVEHALQDGVEADDPVLLDGVMALELVLRETRNDPMIALVLALAHVDIGWAWRGTGWDSMLPRINRRRCAAHFDRAAAILAPHCGATGNSPALVAACCALKAARRLPHTSIADEYEALIALAPQNQRHMRAMGVHLLPCWFGSYQELEVEARRAAARTRDVWGMAGYAWVYFDAILRDDAACAQVDVGFFLDGLRDIVRVRPDQEMINLLAAYCSVALRNGFGTDDEADLVRTQICQAADWLIRDHLTELHPMLWAHAADGFDNNTLVTSPSRFAARGRADALRCLADLFRDEIAQGLRVTFTADGLELDRA